MANFFPLLVWYDDFNDGSLAGWTQGGLGIKSESGTLVTVDAPIRTGQPYGVGYMWVLPQGVNADAPRIYKLNSLTSRCVRYELQINSVSITNSNDYAGCGLWVGPLLPNRGMYIGIERRNGGSMRWMCKYGTDYYFTYNWWTTTPNPATITNIVFYWNNSGGALVLPEDSYSLPNLRWVVYYSINGGSSYVRQNNATSWQTSNYPVEFAILCHTTYGSSRAVLTSDWAKVERNGTDVNAPTITNQDPPNGTTDVSLTRNVSFSINDNAQVKQSTVRAWINGSLAYDGSTGLFQPGFDGPASSCVPNGSHGFDIVIDPTVPYANNATITASAYGEDFGGLFASSTWSFTTEQTIQNISPAFRIRPLSYRLLRLEFPVDVAVSEDLFNVSNYTFIEKTEGALPITVLEVRGPTYADGFTRYADIIIDRATLNALYRLVIKNLRGVTGEVLVADPGLQGDFVSVKTKLDSAIETLPPSFDTTPYSNLYQVLLAVSLEDERVGGQGNLAPLTQVEAPLNTWGNKTWGDDNWGN